MVAHPLLRSLLDPEPAVCCLTEVLPAVHVLQAARLAGVKVRQKLCLAAELGTS